MYNIDFLFNEIDFLHAEMGSWLNLAEIIESNVLMGQCLRKLYSTFDV
jgi:hypothetical protein